MSEKRICFKFMPTPSGRLHVGHAWLLFVMDYLVKQARQAGYQAEIVLVMDDMTGMAQGLNPEGMTENAKGIIEDMAWLEIPFSKVVYNSSFLYVSDLQKSPIYFQNYTSMAHPSLYLPYLNYLMLGAQYYIKNCILDAALEVTHIIRGADQLTKAAVYKVYYELLGMPSPALLYMPLLGNTDGAKISKDGTYGIEAIKKHLKRDDLFIILTKQCIKSQVNVGPATFQQAGTELLGNDWDWVLGNPDSAGKLESFLNRLEAFPRIPGELMVNTGQTQVQEQT